MSKGKGADTMKGDLPADLQSESGGVKKKKNDAIDDR